MADFKVNGITPRFGNIKVGSTNVKKIYQGSTLVWPFQDPPYFTTPTDRAETFNPDAIAVGETFEYNVRAKSDSFPNTDLTITSDNLPNGFSISSTTIDALTGDATATITGLISTGTLKFTLKVEDLYDQQALQEVVLNGVVPDINSYFIIYFDSSGSMKETLPDLERDLLGTDANDPTTLRYYLQKYFAVNTLEERSDGSDRYNAQVIIKSDRSENWAYMLNNSNAGVIPVDEQSGQPVNEPSSVSVHVFLDEMSDVLAGSNSEYLYLGDWVSGNGYVSRTSRETGRIRNLVSTINTVTNEAEETYKDQPAIYQVAISASPIEAGSPESFINPSESIYDSQTNPSGLWFLMGRLQDGVPFGVETFNNPGNSLMNQVTNLKSSINNNQQVNYTGAVYFVTTGNFPQLGAVQSLYDALNNTPESRYFYDNNSLEDYTNQIIFGNPEDPSNKFGVELVKDGQTQPGYYTQLVLNSLKKLGYVGIEPYQG
ncbi:MAG: hypothetical protein ACW977_14310 [Candidatus Thorarchaeota archaeon]|jgi:hypothetical protein